MQSCPGCGLSIDDDAVFCPTCGWRKAAATAQAATSPGETIRSGPAGELAMPARAPAETQATTQAATSVSVPASPVGMAQMVLRRGLRLSSLVLFVSAGIVAFPRYRSLYTTRPRLLEGACFLAAAVASFLMSGGRIDPYSANDDAITHRESWAEYHRRRLTLNEWLTFAAIVAIGLFFGVFPAVRQWLWLLAVILVAVFAVYPVVKRWLSR